MSETPAGAHLPCVQGVIAPLYTPFRADRSIDEAAIPGLLDYLAGTRAVSNVFARSGTGQIFTFTVEEAKRFGRLVRDAAGDRMGVILGCPGEWLDRSAGGRPDPERYIAQGVELTQYAGTIGVDAAVHPLPAALLPKDGEPVADLVFRYYRTIHDASTIPIVIYQPPGTPTEYCLSPELIGRLRTLPRIVGAKISSRDHAVMRPLLAAAKGTTFGVICGHECYWLDGLKQGATGVLGGGSMIQPEIQYQVRARFEAGDMAGACEANADIERAMEIPAGLNRGVACKQYLRRKGVPIEPYVRGEVGLYDKTPAEPYPDEVIDRVEREIDAFRTKYRVA